MSRFQKGNPSGDPDAQHQHLRIPRCQRRGGKQTAKEAQTASSIRSYRIQRCSSNQWQAHPSSSVPMGMEIRVITVRMNLNYSGNRGGRERGTLWLQDLARYANPNPHAGKNSEPLFYILFFSLSGSCGCNLERALRKLPSKETRRSHAKESIRQESDRTNERGKTVKKQSSSASYKKF